MEKKEAPDYSGSTGKRNIIFDIGFSPGDIVVFTRALQDVCEQYPQFNIKIETCCPHIFENHPLINKKNKRPDPQIIPLADNLEKVGYSLERIAKDPRGIFQELIKKNQLAAEKKKGKWYYRKKRTKKDLFYCKQKYQKNISFERYRIHYDDIHNSGYSGRHFSTAFYYELEKHLQIPIHQSSLLPKLHISEEETSWMNQVEEVFKYRGKFWLINAGWKSDYPLKAWPIEYWQDLVNILKDKIQFVQIGELGESHFHPELEGVLDLRGKTDLRELIRLSYHAEGGIGHVSLLHHLMAAWEKPHVTIAGGREGRRWEMYPHSRYMDTNGQLECCSYDGCWMSGRMEGDENKTCKNMAGNVPRCMALIKPARVAEEILNFYYGGILKF